MGAADTACATFGAGAVNDGDLMNSTGTVEVMVLCTDTPSDHDGMLLRTHVLPNRWIIMNIIGAGGESLNWFYNVFCKDMDKDTFFREYLPKVLEEYEDTAVTFSPHLAGDRTSIIDKTTTVYGPL
jgi:xylulokinase